MTTNLTTHERMSRAYSHREPDRVPIHDGPWESTLARWRREGLPRDVAWNRYFDVDRIVSLGTTVIDTSPRFEVRVIEETDTYRIERDEWGITKKNFKPVSSTFLPLDHAIKDRATWQSVRERMQLSPDRIGWSFLSRQYAAWRREGAWIRATPWFGYDIVNARMCGTETVLLGMADDPQWVKDMCDHLCDLALGLLDMVWQAGYEFDELMWFDDMAYRNGLLFSKQMWHDIVRPYQIRAVEWAHGHGIKAHMHCCGNISSLVPELIELGLDALNPLEVKAGMDPARLKREHGRDLLFSGGFDVRLWNDPLKAEENIRTLLPAMMESGGYVFASDHSIPDNVGLEDYRRVVDLAREVGDYRR